jgi:hypothetical protein
VLPAKNVGMGRSKARKNISSRATAVMRSQRWAWGQPDRPRVSHRPACADSATAEPRTHLGAKVGDFHLGDALLFFLLLRQALCAQVGQLLLAVAQLPCASEAASATVVKSAKGRV